MKKKLALILVCALSFGVLASCASNPPSGGTAGTTAAPGSGAYPITIQHALGETVIEKKPERIVTLAWCNQDVPLALGVVPVGMSEANWGVLDGSGMLPWQKDRVEELGGSPVIFKDTDGYDFEAISEVGPDVILCASSGLSQEEYATLSKIAPTIAYPGLAWQTGWRDQVLVNAKGMGMEEEGRQIVADVEALLAEKLALYPQLKGKNAAFAWIDAADFSTISFYTPTDTRSAFLKDLGFAVPDSIAKMAVESGDFYVTISAENADLVSDIDIIITYALADGTLELAKADPLLGSIPAIERGSIILIPEGPLSAACSASCLSIPWAIDDYLTLLAAAAERVPE
jgi:iron complex transport system substrate-binding protein